MEKRDTYKSDKRIYEFLRATAAPLIEKKFHYKRGERVSIDEPFIVVSNHTTDLDMIWLGDMFKNHLYFVSSEHVVRSGFAGWILNKCFHPIVREKATVGLNTVIDMKKRLKSGYNVGLFAEGIKSADGLSNEVVESTAAVIKKLGFTLVTARIHGGFFTSPRWASNTRIGEISAEIINIYKPEDLASLSREELSVIINKDIYEDAYAYNADKKIAYKSSKAAEGIEYEFVVCPHCKKLGQIKSHKSEFFCDCGLKGTYDEYGMLSINHSDFKTIPQWDEWQKVFLSSMTIEDNDDIIVSHPNQVIRQISKDHTEEIVGQGDISISGKNLSVGEKVIPIGLISDYNIIGHGYLLLSTKDKKYYEIKNKEHKIPGYLYYLLIQIIKNKNTQKE